MTIMLSEMSDRDPAPAVGSGLAAITAFPKPGDAYIRIAAMMNDAHSSVADIGRTLESDSRVKDVLLKIANSPVFGFASEVESVPRAVSLIGTRGLRDLMVVGAWGASLCRIGGHDPRLAGLWRHSLHCAILARMVAQHLRIPYVEQFFVSGLLHDVGLFGLCIRGGHGDGALHLDDAHESVNRVVSEADLRHGIEVAALLADWRLPQSIIEPIVYHRDARQAKKYVRFSAIVQLAEIVVAYSAESTPAYLWDLCGLYPDEVERLAARSSAILEEVMGVFADA